MFKIIYACITGLVAAALLHIVLVLALPRFSDRDAYTRITALGPAGTFHSLNEKEKAGSLFSTDPFVSASVCAFDLGISPIAVSASGAPAFWSFAVFDRASNEVFSISDRSVEPGKLDMIVATASQAALLRKTDPDIAERSILIETRGKEGYLVLRTVTPHLSLKAQSSAFLESARCSAALP